MGTREILVLFGLVAFIQSTLLRAEEAKVKHGKATASVGTRGAPVLKHKETLLIFDCKPPGSGEVKKLFDPIYETKVVELEDGKTEKELLALIDEKIRAEKTRNIAIFCHGTFSGEDYKLYRAASGDEDKHAWEIDGKKLRTTVDAAIRATGIKNPIFYLNTCGALGIKTSFTPGTSCLSGNGTICAACPANLPVKGDVMPRRLLEVFRHCEKYDKNHDGKIQVSELADAFGAMNKEEKKRIKKFLAEKRADFLKATKVPEKDYEAQKALFEKIFLSYASHEGAPFLLGKDNEKTVVFACPQVPKEEKAK